MALKTVRTSIRPDKEDIDFLRDVMVFENTSEGARWCIKFCRIMGSLPSKESKKRKRGLMAIADTPKYHQCLLDLLKEKYPTTPASATMVGSIGS